MHRVTCPRKGNKMAQEKDCDCDTFRLFLNFDDEAVVECTKCNTRYSVKTIEKNSMRGVR